MTTRWKYKSNQKSPVYLKILTRIPSKTNLSVLKGRLIEHVMGVKNCYWPLWTSLKVFILSIVQNLESCKRIEQFLCLSLTWL